MLNFTLGFSFLDLDLDSSLFLRFWGLGFLHLHSQKMIFFILKNFNLKFLKVKVKMNVQLKLKNICEYKFLMFVKKISKQEVIVINYWKNSERRFSWPNFSWECSHFASARWRSGVFMTAQTQAAVKWNQSRAVVARLFWLRAKFENNFLLRATLFKISDDKVTILQSRNFFGSFWWFYWQLLTKFLVVEDLCCFFS